MTDKELLTTTFAASVRVIEPTTEVLNEARASLNDLKNLLPDGVTPENDGDLLYIAANLAVPGMVNLNDDGLTVNTAIKTYKQFEKRQVNIEHSRKNVVGYILKTGLSEIGTNRLITEEEAKNLGQPFNIAVVAVVWRVVNKELCDALEEASSPSSGNYEEYSLSFEVGFSNFYIAVLPEGEHVIANAIEIIGRDNPKFAKYKSHLKAYKGNGISPDNIDHRLYRIMPEDVIPLGAGIVETPAAQVKGITTIESSEVITNKQDIVVSNNDSDDMEEDDDDDEEDDDDEDNDDNDEDEEEEDDEEKDDEICAYLKDSYQHIIKILEKSEKTGVLPVTIKNNFIDINMNDLKSLKEKVAKAEKLEDFKEIAIASQNIADVIAAESERLAKEKKVAEGLAENAEKAKQEAIAAHDALKKEFDALKSQLTEIKAAQMAAEAEKKFTERMNAIDAEFEFSDEERAEIVADVRDIDDESFAKWMTKSKKLMKEKTKEFKKKCSEEKEETAKALKAKCEEVKAALEKAGIKATLTDDLNFVEIIASAKETVTSTDLYNHVPAPDSLKDKVAKAFAGVTIGGKTFEELSAKQ